jgi:predicted phosphodiesterase
MDTVMKIKILSDLHIEFGDFFIPDGENEKETVVVLAGDIGLVKKPYTYRDFIADTCDRFKKVIWIMGNHEFYGTNFPTALAKVWNATLEHENLEIVEKETVVIDNVAFVCATLWTSMDNNNIMTMADAKLWMNDYKQIRTGPEYEPWRQKLAPLDTMSDHRRAVEFIFPEIVKQKEDGKKVVVVTHHLPSFQSIHESRKGDELNGAYASELFEDIADTKPDVWIHGHTHDSSDYMLADTRVICNPRGYKGHELNRNFKHDLTIEI